MLPFLLKKSLFLIIRLENPHANLACTYIQGENFEEAAKLMGLCLEQYKSWGTEEELPEEYMKYYHHYSFGLMAQEHFQNRCNTSADHVS